MSQSLQVVIMRATDLQSAIPGTLPAAQVELRAIYNDEEIAFHKTTVCSHSLRDRQKYVHSRALKHRSA